MAEFKLTSVKILEDLYKKFKISTVNTSMNLQKLTNRSIFLYLENEKHKSKIDLTDELTVSGSRL
jgi:hypothetical protein